MSATAADPLTQTKLARNIAFYGASFARIARKLGSWSEHTRNGKRSRECTLGALNWKLPNSGYFLNILRLPQLPHRHARLHARAMQRIGVAGVQRMGRGSVGGVWAAVGRCMGSKAKQQQRQCQVATTTKQRHKKRRGNEGVKMHFILCKTSHFRGLAKNGERRKCLPQNALQ